MGTNEMGRGRKGVRVTDGAGISGGGGGIC